MRNETTYHIRWLIHQPVENIAVPPSDVLSETIEKLTIIEFGNPRSN